MIEETIIANKLDFDSQKEIFEENCKALIQYPIQRKKLATHSRTNSEKIKRAIVMPSHKTKLQPSEEIVAKAWIIMINFVILKRNSWFKVWSYLVLQSD